MCNYVTIPKNFTAGTNICSRSQRLHTRDGENVSVNTVLDTNAFAFASADELECGRPLIVEHPVLKRIIGDDVDLENETAPNSATTRLARELMNVRIGGKFRIRMVEGINTPSLWVGGENNTYTEDGYGSVQYVRAITIVVYDMNKGLGPMWDEATAIQSNLRPNRAEPLVADANGSLVAREHLLAPAISDILAGMDFDVSGAMVETATPVYNDENVINLKYATAADNPAGVDEEGGLRSGHGAIGEDIFFPDPLVRRRKARRFKVLKDVRLAFTPRGTTTASFNQDGARQADWEYTHSIGNIRTAYDNVAPPLADLVTARNSEQVNKRVFTYFMPSMARNWYGVQAPTVGSGHHYFQVYSYDEWASGTPKHVTSNTRGGV